MKIITLLLLASPCFAQTFPIGICFRHTAGFVTDPTNYTHMLDTDAYPVTRSGLTFGWVTAVGGSSGTTQLGLDRSAAVDPRLAGINYNNNSAANTNAVRINLPAGSYNVSFAFGDQAASHTGGFWELFDGTNSLMNFGQTSTAADSYLAADGSVYTDANWLTTGFSKTVTVTVSSGALFIRIGRAATGDLSAMASILISSASTCTIPSLALLGVGCQ